MNVAFEGTLCKHLNNPTAFTKPFFCIWRWSHPFDLQNDDPKIYDVVRAYAALGGLSVATPMKIIIADENFDAKSVQTRKLSIQALHILQCPRGGHVDYGLDFSLQAWIPPWLMFLGEEWLADATSGYSSGLAFLLMRSICPKGQAISPENPMRGAVVITNLLLTSGPILKKQCSYMIFEVLSPSTAPGMGGGATKIPYPDSIANISLGVFMSEDVVNEPLDQSGVSNAMHESKNSYKLRCSFE
nr:hypothetical protein [Tanacetum cinerariifolium]